MYGIFQIGFNAVLLMIYAIKPQWCSRFSSFRQSASIPTACAFKQSMFSHLTRGRLINTTFQFLILDAILDFSLEFIILKFRSCAAPAQEHILIYNICCEILI